MKVSATVSPERLERAKQLTGCDNVSEVIDRGLQALIVSEAERTHVDGYARAPQGADTVASLEPGVWAEVPWDDE